MGFNDESWLLSPAAAPHGSTVHRAPTSWTRWLRRSTASPTSPPFLVAAPAPTEVAQHYVETFDLAVVVRLYPTYYRWLGTHASGILRWFKTAYRAAGFVPSDALSTYITCHWSGVRSACAEGIPLLRSERADGAAAQGCVRRARPTCMSSSMRCAPSCRSCADMRLDVVCASTGRAGPPKEAVGWSLRATGVPDWTGARR